MSTKAPPLPPLEPGTCRTVNHPNVWDNPFSLRTTVDRHMSMFDEDAEVRARQHMVDNAREKLQEEFPHCLTCKKLSNRVDKHPDLARDADLFSLKVYCGESSPPRMCAARFTEYGPPKIEFFPEPSMGSGAMSSAPTLRIEVPDKVYTYMGEPCTAEEYFRALAGSEMERCVLGMGSIAGTVSVDHSKTKPLIFASGGVAGLDEFSKVNMKKALLGKLDSKDSLDPPWKVDEYFSKPYMDPVVTPAPGRDKPSIGEDDAW